MQQIAMWSGLTEDCKAAGRAPFLEIQEMHKEATERRLRRELSEEFLAATLSALSDMTVGFLQRQPEQAAMYRETGFEMLWAALARKK